MSTVLYRINHSGLKMRSSSLKGSFMYSVLNAALPISLFFVFNFSSVQYEAQREVPCGVKAAKRKPIQFVSSPSAMRFNKRLGTSSE